MRPFSLGFAREFIEEIMYDGCGGWGEGIYVTP